jgi:hypothetical protein
MTIAPATTETVYQIGGTASLGPFNTVFPYAEDQDVSVYLDQGAGPVQIFAPGQLTLTDGGALPNVGTVLLAAGLLPLAGQWPAGSTLTIARNTPQSQPSAFGELGQFSPSASESALDNIARQVQDLAAKIKRAWTSAFGQAGFTLPDPAARANTALTFDGAGNPAFVPLSPLPTQSVITTITAAGPYNVSALTPPGDLTLVVNQVVGAAMQINLPQPAGTGRKIHIVDGKGDCSANNITLTPTPPYLINNVAFWTLLADYESVTIQDADDVWRVL